VSGRHVDGSDPAGVEAPAGDAVETTNQEARPDDEERPTVVVRDKRKVRDPGPPPQPEIIEAELDIEAEPIPLGAELAALRGDVDELTRDLQRITAEYANYRKRVERDRALAGEQAVGGVLAALLPVLDDIDRAREHDDLVGPFGSVAEQLINALSKFGLTPFGEKGDPFDPTRHEAVAHDTSADVTEPTCVGILRRGYLLGNRLLRPALVAVADPE
jgi:molecular chaperone GrpE